MDAGGKFFEALIAGYQHNFIVEFLMAFLIAKQIHRFGIGAVFHFFDDGFQLGNLPNGATVQVVAIPDVKRLSDIGQDKTALGIVDCEVLWALTVLGFPCGSMLSPFNSEADRLYVQSRNAGYNAILESVTVEKAAQNPGKVISYTDVTFTEPFLEEDISNIDCFHPSWRGERTLSREIWNQGPFRDFQGGS